MGTINEKSPLLEVTTNVRNNKRRKLPGECLSKKKRKQLIKHYYEEQENLKEFYVLDNENLNEENRQQYVAGRAAKDQSRSRIDKFLASAVFFLNIVILCGNLTASILSGSYSVISAFVDSAMDITSSTIIFCALWAINNTNRFNYPRGRQRLEILAVTICSIIMGVANVMMIIQSVESIIYKMVDPDANLPTIVILWTGITLKIIFMIICYRHGTPSSKVLALDQRNDILTSFVAFCGAFIGDYYWKYADPMGAILVW
uniref:Transmembrane protein 163 n=1 Tax=Panagrolaimus sp. ES5 TaxID=591445 RepID=A0AC34FBR7_9BILA